MESAASYLPDVLEMALGQHPVGAPRVEPVNGTLVMLDVSGFTPLTERLARVAESVRLAGRMPARYEHALSMVDLAMGRFTKGESTQRWAERMLLRAEKALRLSGALPDAERAAALRAAIGRGDTPEHERRDLVLE